MPEPTPQPAAHPTPQPVSEPVSQFICFLEPARQGMPEAPTPEEAEIVRAHAEHCTRLRDRGVLVLAGRTQTPPFVGIIILEAPSPAEAERLIAGDPGVARGVFRARVQPYRVAIARESRER